MSTEQEPEVASEVVITERRGPALWIFINREHRRNAINPDVIDGIARAIRSATGDASLRAIVLTGKGDKAFCAGADLTRGTGVFTEGSSEPTTDFGRLASRTPMSEGSSFSSVSNRRTSRSISAACS